MLFSVARPYFIHDTKWRSFITHYEQSHYSRFSVLISALFSSRTRVCIYVQRLAILMLPGIVFVIVWTQFSFHHHTFLNSVTKNSSQQSMRDVEGKRGNGAQRMSNSKVGVLQQPSNQQEGLENVRTPFKVPNIVHYTWYAEPHIPMTFKQYIGVLSAHKILKPDVIYIHMNITQPTGEYFKKIAALDTVKAVNDGCPKSLLGKILITNGTQFFSDYSDLGRIKYLLEYGGIYLDYDVFVIQSFDKYRRDYEFTLGQEQDRNSSYDLLNAGIIISAKDAPFLRMWANAYVDDYQPDRWIYNSGQKPTMLWKRFPDLIHVEKTKFNRPNWRENEIVKIWGNETFNWKENYALHTWYRYRSRVPWYKENYGELAPDENDVKRMNNTYAAISRYILAL